MEMAMKIEKVNDNQIRCTLTREDLASRQLKISELAYGTEKAKNLFRDMMQQANYEFGFEAEDIPLMIEAIPLNAECLVLIITKVEDPEELDTRFSRFAPSVTENDEEDILDYDDASDEMMDFFRQLKKPEDDYSNELSSDSDDDRIFMFSMPSMQQVMSASAIVGPCYNGVSSLYKDAGTNHYLLMVRQNDSPREDFDRICNILSEYGSVRRLNASAVSYLTEHMEVLIPADALQLLSGK